MDDYAAFDQLARAVYLAARAGAVDCTDGFDLATSKLEVSPWTGAPTELALLSVECAEASQPRMAEVALSLLSAVAAGLSVDPGRWPEQFDDLMGRIAGRFPRVEPRRRARAFVLGLLSGLRRKNCWTIAEQAGDADARIHPPIRS